MVINLNIHDTDFGVGDVVRVYQTVKEGGESAQAGKSRTQIFEGTVIAIKRRGIGKTITVRRIGEAKIGIERIFPVNSPTVTKIVVKRKGTKGIKQAKLYFIRNKPK